MRIDRMTEQALRAELSQAIKAVLDKAERSGDFPTIGPAAAAYGADAVLAMLLMVDEAQEQLRRDGMLSEE